MAIMNRNVNLEEINTDAFMGITFLSHQTLGQKIIFISGIVIGIGINLLNSFLWNLNTFIAFGLTMIPLLFGIAFGCNYNEDLSLIQYLSLIVSNPVVHLYSHPMEDLAQLRKKSEQLMKEEEEKQQKTSQVTDESQKKLLKTLLIVGVVFIVVVILGVILIKTLKVEEVHHRVVYEESYEEETVNYSNLNISDSNICLSDDSFWSDYI